MEAANNMRVCIIDGKQITDREALHGVLADSLQLPDWYGRNLDALYDCLSDMQEETEIRLLHEETLDQHLGRYAQTFKKVLRRVGRENPRVHFLRSSQ